MKCAKAYVGTAWSPALGGWCISEKNFLRHAVVCGIRIADTRRSVHVDGRESSPQCSIIELAIAHRITSADSTDDTLYRSQRAGPKKLRHLAILRASASRRLAAEDVSLEWLHLQPSGR